MIKWTVSPSESRAYSAVFISRYLATFVIFMSICMITFIMNVLFLLDTIMSLWHSAEVKRACTGVPMLAIRRVREVKMFETGSRVGPYKVEQLLEKGGMAEVYK